MGEDPAKAEPGRYRAFISYNHSDAKFAHWLHARLERWRLPDKSRLAPVFIDRAELAAGSDLSAQVREALAGSAALIVVCSPKARTSRWVGQEIALFRELHPDRPVLAALIEGEPGEAFPDELVRSGAKALEPLAADFRKGHDGKRLGLLKLAAGLTALPLDQLVQRDAQARQRRVMAITAAAVLLVLILSAALVIALRARAEAERQRAEAEGLVEFMLTDLRDKLKGVGRLEIMGAVNERVMAHYGDDVDISRLPNDVLLRRARLLLAMGEDDLDRTGTKKRGTQEIDAAWNITKKLLGDNPKNSEYMFWHAQSEYWKGYAAFSSLNSDSRRNTTDAFNHWSEYARLARQLAEIEPKKARSFRELAYSEGALCGLNISIASSQATTRQSCTFARHAMERAIALDPGKVKDQIDLASRIAWEADAVAVAGRWQEARDLRYRQIRVIAKTLEENPRDTRLIEANMLANMGIAELLRKMNEHRAAKSAIQVAAGQAKHLIELDPSNRSWKAWQSQILQSQSTY